MTTRSARVGLLAVALTTNLSACGASGDPLGVNPDPDLVAPCRAVIDGTWTGLVEGDIMRIRAEFDGALCNSGALAINPVAGSWSWRSSHGSLSGWFRRPTGSSTSEPTLPDTVDFDLLPTESATASPVPLKITGSVPLPDTLRGLVFGGWVSIASGDTLVAIDSTEVVLARSGT